MDPARGIVAPTGFVLVADDNLVNQRHYGALLGDLGLRAVATTTISEGHAVISDGDGEAPRFALVDSGLPGLFGDTGVHMWHALGGGPYLPVVAMVPMGHDSDSNRFLRWGVDAVLGLPVEPGALRAVVRRWGSALDLSVLAGLRSDLNDDAALSGVIQAFIDQLDPRVERVVNAVEVSDVAEFARVGHTLASSAALVGAGRLEAVARRVELAAAEKRVPTQAELERLQRLSDEAATELTAHIATLR